MIYGDNPVKWNERKADPNDPLGLNTYTYKPDITAIMQSGNQYAYCMSNPLMYVDPTGNIGTPISWALAVIAGVAGGFYGNYLADRYGLTGWKRAALITGVAVGGAAIGFIAGEFLVGFTTTFLVSNPAVIMSLPTSVLTLFGLNGNNLAVLGRYAEGVGYVNLAQKLGASFFQIATSVWDTMSATQQWAANQKFIDDMIRQGKHFIFSSNAYDTLRNAANSPFADEIRYLERMGYVIVENGWKMIPKK